MVVRQISATCVVPYRAFNVQTRHLRVYDDHSLSLSLSHCKFFLNLSLSSSLRGHLLQDDSATTHSQICRSYCYPSSAWECVSLKFIYTPSLYNFFNFSHLCFFEYVHFFPPIHKFWHLPPSTTNQPSQSLNFTWCQNKQLWI
jgi:hypothetical protein